MEGAQPKWPTQSEIDGWIARDREIVGELLRRAAAGEAVVEVASWLHQELATTEAEFQTFSRYMWKAFKIPIRILNDFYRWEGFGWGGSMSDAQLSARFDPLVPRDFDEINFSYGRPDQ
ncbi:hypothetical protein ACWCW7_17640 [Nocardia tengchongensis]